MFDSWFLPVSSTKVATTIQREFHRCSACRTSSNWYSWAAAWTLISSCESVPSAFLKVDPVTSIWQSWQWSASNDLRRVFSIRDRRHYIFWNKKFKPADSQNVLETSKKKTLPKKTHHSEVSSNFCVRKMIQKTASTKSRHSPSILTYCHTCPGNLIRSVSALDNLPPRWPDSPCWVAYIQWLFQNRNIPKRSLVQRKIVDILRSSKISLNHVRFQKTPWVFPTIPQLLGSGVRIWQAAVHKSLHFNADRDDPADGSWISSWIAACTYV